MKGPRVPDAGVIRVGALVSEVTREFSAARLHFGHGTRSAREEAAWLVSHVLGHVPGDLRSHTREPVRPAAERRIRALAGRRLSERIPLAYLLHEAWLGELRFHVDRRVIVPRSYIEIGRAHV